MIGNWFEKRKTEKKVILHQKLLVQVVNGLEMGEIVLMKKQLVKQSMEV